MNLICSLIGHKWQLVMELGTPEECVRLCCRCSVYDRITHNGWERIGQTR